MDIVICFDHGFVMPTGVMMYSVCANNQDMDITFHAVTDDSVTQKDKDDLTENLKAFERHAILLFYTVNKKNDNLPSIGNRHGLTYATYYRLFLTDILPESIDKVLYLDGDMIVRHSLLPLWNTDLTGYAVAAVNDSLHTDIHYDTRLEYPLDKGYFNAGVLLINLRYWRKNNIPQRLIDFMESYHDVLTFHDQDILNGVLWNQKVSLPIKYNLVSGYLYKRFSLNTRKDKQEIMEARKDPVIVHFAANFKPWESYIRYPHPFCNIFYHYQDMTKWKNHRVDNRSLRLKTKNFITDHLRRIKVLPPLNSFYIDIKPIA